MLDQRKADARSLLGIVLTEVLSRGGAQSLKELGIYYCSTCTMLLDNACGSSTMLVGWNSRGFSWLTWCI